MSEELHIVDEDIKDVFKTAADNARHTGDLESSREIIKITLLAQIAREMQKLNQHLNAGIVIHSSGGIQ